MKNALRNRLGWKLLALFLVLALAVGAIFMGGMQRAFAGGWQSWVRPLVADYVHRLAAEIGSPPDLQRAQAVADRLPLRLRIDGPNLHWRSDNRVDKRPPEEWDEDASPELHSPQRHFHGGMRGWLWRESLGEGYVLRLGFARFPAREEPRYRAGLTLVALAYAVVRHWLRPLQDIHAGAQRFGTGDFAHPIPVRRHDEMGQVAAQVNAMAISIHQMLEAKRALLLAISHELRSPLTRARLNAELSAPPPGADADLHQAHAALLHDLAQMRDLVSDLLETERLSNGHSALQRESLDLPALAAEVALAEGAGRVTVQVEAGTQAALAQVSADPMRLRLALRNLLSNALRHQPADAGPVELQLSSQAGQAVLSVRDQGPGVPADQLAQLGNAFYRADAARARSTGGVGLGLHLCRLVAQAHGGSLALQNLAPGFEATLRLPLRA